MLRLTFILTGFLFINGILSAQEKEKLKLKDRITIDGYIKYMNTNSFVNLDTIIGDNLIHNRIKLKATISEKISAIVEMRNRIFYGEATRLNPSLGALLDNDMGELDLSFVPLDRSSFVIHSIFDRAYFKYQSKNKSDSL